MATYVTAGSATNDNSGGALSAPALNVQAGDAVWIFFKHEGANATLTPSVVGGTSSQTFKNGGKINHSNGDLNGQQFVIESAAADSALVIQVTPSANRPYRRIAVIQWRPGSGKVFAFTATTNESNAQGSTSTTFDAGSLTTSDAAVLAQGVGEYNAITYTAGTGWTKVVDNFIEAEYRIETAGGTFDPVCTSAGGSMEWIALSCYLLENASGGGGTTYNQSVGGTLTSSGALTKAVRKGLAGVLSFAGALSKTVARSLAGTLTSSGALSKRTSRALTGTLTSSGALVANVVIKKALTAALSFGGTLTTLLIHASSSTARRIRTLGLGLGVWH